MKFIVSLIKFVLFLAILGGLGYGGWWGWQTYNKKTAPLERYSTEAASIGGITVTINSTGVVEPEELINVGAQVSGRILSFGTDIAGKTVDYSSEVDEGCVLAYVDSSLYEAELLQSQAQVHQAQAGIERAIADSAQYAARLILRRNDFDRAERLVKSGAIGRADYDAALAEFHSAEANMQVGIAALAQAHASLAAAEAAFIRSKQNMDYCKIISPVRGVVIDRRVNVGQTVVSSMSASSIFLIAKDLRKMQVWVSVNEADIGKIKPGQSVTFNIDAFPGREFKGYVGKIRLNAALSSNVVIYTVEVQADNSDGTLLPYLTANLRFITDSCHNEILVPNTALRFVPESSRIPEEYDKYTDIEVYDGQVKGVVWSVQTDAKGVESLTPIELDILMTDDIYSAVRGQITEGTLLATGVEEVTQLKAADAAGNNPFMPNFPRRNRGNTKAKTPTPAKAASSSSSNPPPPSR